MYDNVYDLFVKDRYMTPMLEPKFYNNIGEVCEEEDGEQFGDQVDLTFKHPKLVFVTDECGTNTNMSKNKLAPGNKMCSTRGVAVTIPACTRDFHFTTMVMTALTGEAVYDVVIFKREQPLTYEETYKVI